MAFVQIARNAVVAKLINPAPEVRNLVNNLLSYTVEGAMGWSGKSSFLDITNNTFPAGFTYLVQEELARVGHIVQIVAKPHAEPLGPESPIVDEFGNDDPRYDYQLKAVRQVEKHGSGIIRVATGGGKSKIAKLLAARFGRVTLFITTRGILLYQMKDQLDEIGVKTGVIGDGEMTFSREVNLGMVQTLIQAINPPSFDEEVRAVVKSIHTAKNKDPNMSPDQVRKIAQEAFDRKAQRKEAILRFLSLVEVVIGEEAHEVGGTSYFEILRHCKNASIRVALTATPFMRDSAADNMRLMAAFGPVLIDVSEELLINRGILARPYFKFVDAPAPLKLHKTSPFERAYELGYISNEEMTKLIVLDAVKAKTKGLPTLTLVARKKHGENIKEMMEKAGLKVSFIKGEDDMVGRRKALKDLAAGAIDVVIGTNILDVGVDVPAVGLVQLCAGMKAQVSLRQRIGRGLRFKKSGPNVAFVTDYSCNANITLREHANQREMIIRKTPGFVEGCLEPGQDFDWDIFATK